MPSQASEPVLEILHANLFILAVNNALDSGKHDHLTQEDVKSHIQSGDLIPWLAATVGNDADFSLYKAMPDVAEELTRRLRRGMSVWAGNEGRKWGLEHRGLCLLIGWTNELIHQEFGEVRFGNDFYDPED